MLKTALAVTLAVSLAQSLGMERISLAAIVAVVTVQKTFYHSVLQSVAKVGSVLLGALLGTGLGALLGNNPLSFGIVTILAIVICLQLKWQDQIPITLVTAIYLISFPADGFQVVTVVEQFLLAFLGAVSALGVNYFFTPNHNKEIASLTMQIDQELRSMLQEIARRIADPAEKMGSSLSERTTRVRREIARGLEIAKLFREEQKFHFSEDSLSDKYRTAFRTLDALAESLEEMNRLSKRINTAVPQAIYLVKLLRILEKTQENALRGRKNHYKLLDEALENLQLFYDRMELPTTREEFISRASLYHIFQEMIKYYKRLKALPGMTLEA